MQKTMRINTLHYQFTLIIDHIIHIASLVIYILIKLASILSKYFIIAFIIKTLSIELYFY